VPAATRVTDRNTATCLLVSTICAIGSPSMNGGATVTPPVSTACSAVDQPEGVDREHGCALYMPALHPPVPERERAGIAGFVRPIARPMSEIAHDPRLAMRLTMLAASGTFNAHVTPM
jgi:hypothetical protein